MKEKDGFEDIIEFQNAISQTPFPDIEISDQEAAVLEDYVMRNDDHSVLAPNAAILTNIDHLAIKFDDLTSKKMNHLTHW